MDEAKFEKLKEQVKTLINQQSQPGTWDFDPYMHGMLNGMILIQAMIEENEPVFKEAPKKWIFEEKKKSRLIIPG